MSKITRSNIFWFAFLAIFIVSFLIFLNTGRIYQSEMEIILIPKNEAVGQNMDQVINNAKNLSMTLSFYDEIIKNPDVEDKVQELPAEKRKEFWDASVRVEKVDNSGIMKITNYHSDRVQAEIINRQVVSTLIARISQYYNIDKDIDVRIIEGPIIGTAMSRSPYASLGYGLILGLISGFLVAVIFSLIPDSTVSENKESRLRFSLADSLSDFPVFSKNKEEKSEEKPKAKEEEISDTISFDKKPESIIRPSFNKKSEMTVKKTEKPEILTEGKKSNAVPSFIASQKKATAPGNLPVADEEAINIVEEKLYSSSKKEDLESAKGVSESSQEDKTDTSTEPPKDVFREASQEEVKERLNKLLSGKL